MSQGFRCDVCGKLYGYTPEMQIRQTVSDGDHVFWDVCVTCSTKVLDALSDISWETNPGCPYSAFAKKTRA